MNSISKNTIMYSQPKIYYSSNRIKPFKRQISINVPIWLLRRKEISTGAKLLYGRLLLFIGQNLFCFPSQHKLAEELGISIRTVNRYIKELKKYKLIEVEQKGRKKTAKFYVLSHEWENDFRNQQFGRWQY